MGKPFLKNIMKNNPPLFDAIVAFNSGMADIPIHAAKRMAQNGDTALASHTAHNGETTPAVSTLNDRPALARLTPAGKALAASGLMEQMAASPRGRRRIAALLPQLVQNPPQGWYISFMSKRSRLALLTPQTLHSLALHFGLAVHATDVARCIARTEVQAIKDAFGGDAYLFAVKRAPFLAGNCSTLLPPIGAEDLPEKIRAHGYLGVALCFAREPIGLRKRLAMKLPKVFFNTHGIKDPTTADAVWPALQRILLSEVAPEWAPCFA